MLAVVVLNWNGGDDTIACLRSVYESDYDGELVVYVPDNASTDGSPERVAREFPQARVIQNGGNLGFSGGNNPGWRRAVADGAEWVFFLNNDAAVAPDCLRRLVEVCRAHPEIGAASPRIFYGTPATHPDGSSTPGGDPEVWFEKGICRFDFLGGIRHVESTPGERDMLWYESPLCTGCGFLTTAKMLEETGGFDEDFFAYFEDVDLSLKIRAKGYQCAVVPGASAWHKVGQSTSKEASPGYVFYCVRNLYYLAERHASRPDEWAAFLKVYFRQSLLLSAHYGNNGSITMAATVLQAYRCAMRGQIGQRPQGVPSLRLRTAARTVQNFYYYRNMLRLKNANAASSL